MRVLGLDGGIASIGWALLEIDDGGGSGSIVAAGTRMFDTPETDKERRPKNAIRGEKRGLRRVIRRRRQRMAAVRRLFFEHGMLATAGQDALKRPGLDPWELRVRGLDKRLTPEELAVALGNMARHRGFRSNAKGAPANSTEDGKVKKALEDTRDRLAKWRSVAEMLLKDEAFAGRLRNREGDYSRTVQRSDLEAETRLLFTRQRSLGNAAATVELMEAFQVIAFSQRPLQDSHDKVGDCPFEADEKRVAKHAYSFELFRFLARLASLTVVEGRIARRLTPQEIAAGCADFGATAKISFKALRKRIALAPDARFDKVKPDEEARDVVARTGEAAAGSHALRSVIGEAHWAALVRTPQILDDVAAVLSFREDLGSIRIGLQGAGTDSLVADTIMADLEDGRGKLARFSGAGHISAKAARALIPHLARGMVYSEACAAAGYDHTAGSERRVFDTGCIGKEALAAIIAGQRISPDLVGSPVARKALLEAVKQVKAVVEEYGVPDAVHVELARDVGKSIKERREIEAGIDKRNKQKDRLRIEFAENVGRPPAGAEELLRYELWKEQNGRCLYTDALISPHQLIAADNSVQVDHILPWSRFGDDGYTNKALCIARANQEKRGRTPFEWFAADKAPVEWDTFVARVEAIKYMKGFKKRNYLLKDGGDEVANRFRDRNLVDTRWATRLLAEALRAMYRGDEGRRRVFTRPGAITDRLRRAWGLQWLKKDEKGQRLADDRHHALDAIVVAATTERMLQRLTQAFKESEAKGDHRDFRSFSEPWLGFRQQAMAAVDGVFVSRAERRRARGEAHAATIRQVVVDDDGVATVYERRKVADLKPTDLERIKDPERNAAVVANLRAWMDAGKPADQPPRSPKGDVIAKIRLKTNKKVDVEIRGGAADRGEMARVDVFRKTNGRGVPQYFLVPIYPHQIATMDAPPAAAIVAHKPENFWAPVENNEFLFSVFPHSLIAVTKPDGEVIKGYFKGVDRQGAQISLAEPSNITNVRAGIGSKTLLAFEKYSVDRLGRCFGVSGERRTWRGAVCT